LDEDRASSRALRASAWRECASCDEEEDGLESVESRARTCPDGDGDCGGSCNAEAMVVYCVQHLLRFHCTVFCGSWFVVIMMLDVNGGGHTDFRSLFPC